MNYVTRESQEQMPDSFEVYTFTCGTETFRYTSYFEDITYKTNTFKAVSIQRSGYHKDLIEGVIRCNVQAPVSTMFVSYIVSFPVLPIRITITKIYISDILQTGLIFNGYVKSFSIEKQIANAECVSTIDELNQKVPRVFIQSLCNNVFGGSVCGVNISGYTTNETVLGIEDNGRILTLTGVDNFYGWFGGFKQGIVTFNGDSRFISDQVHSQIEIHFPFRDLTVGSIIAVSLGCDKTGLTCKYKFFDNRNNFVGMPYVPLGPNPVNWGVD